MNRRSLLLALGQAAALAQTGAPSEMVRYHMGFLVKGERWSSEQTPELRKLQEGHMAHLRKMAETGKLVVAGPFADNGRIRGVLVFRGVTMEEAKALAEADPTVQAGHMALELHPWLVQKGVLP